MKLMALLKLQTESTVHARSFGPFDGYKTSSYRAHSNPSPSITPGCERHVCASKPHTTSSGATGRASSNVPCESDPIVLA
jgi:hypothetical protein